LVEVGDTLDVPRSSRYVGLEEFLTAAELDIAVVMAQPNLHGRLVGLALRAGLHVIVDKPLALELTVAWALVEIAEAKGLTLSVLHHDRTTPYGRELRRRIDAGQIGRVESFVCSGKGYYGGYDLLNAAPHLLNSVRGLSNADLTWVQGTLWAGGSLATEKDIVWGPGGFGLVAGEHALLTAGMSDGSLVTLWHQHHAQPVAESSVVLVRGSEGQLGLASNGLYASAQTGFGPNVGWERLALPSEQGPVPGLAVDESQADLWFVHELVCALDNGRQHPSSGREAALGLEVIMGGLASHFHHGGGRVALPNVDRRHPLRKARAAAGLGAPHVAPAGFDEWLAAERARLAEEPASSMS
jgi:predicted dehydrogenase